MKFYFGNKKSEPRSFLMNWKQVHGVAAVEVTTPGQHCGDVDALWTRVKSLPVAINTADCVPVLLFRPDGKAVAAIHSGWRGTYEQIIDAFFKALPTDLNQPREWSAHIGPSIRACCYQVSEELVTDFKIRFAAVPASDIEPAPRMLDLIAVLRHECQRLGVRIESVHPDCTRCTRDGDELKYFSYRAGDRKSRQYSWIEL